MDKFATPAVWLMAALLFVFTPATVVPAQNDGAPLSSEAVTAGDLPVTDPAPPASRTDRPASAGDAASSPVGSADGYFPEYNSSGLDIFKAAGTFVLVMALLFLALKGLGRLSRFRGAKARDSIIELRGIQPLDNRKYLAAVEVEGHIIVVGVASDRITPLAHWAADESLDFNPGNTDLAEKKVEFSLDEIEPHLFDINVADHQGRGRK